MNNKKSIFLSVARLILLFMLASYCYSYASDLLKIYFIVALIFLLPLAIVLGVMQAKEIFGETHKNIKNAFQNMDNITFKKLIQEIEKTPWFAKILFKSIYYKELNDLKNKYIPN